MKTLVFTICAANYVGLAKVLCASVKKHSPNVDFRIYIAEHGSDDVVDQSIFYAPDSLRNIIDPVEYANMAFTYNITEFCTALKSACFMHGFADGYANCIYMDPDILVMASVDNITDQLRDAAILVTPHLCLPALSEGPRADRGILATGVYNLGFLALRNCSDTRAFLQWWHARLRTQAFNDHYNALFTDQRWIDFVPSLFSSQAVRVWRHLGCNVAPWNYHERRITQTSAGFAVQSRYATCSQDADAVPLIFLHFSGFDFKRILDGQFDQLNLADAETHADLTPLYELYGQSIRAIADEMKRHLTRPYSYDAFADGSAVLPSHRRLLRVWRERHGDVADPFAVGSDTFHEALKVRGLLARPNGRDLTADKATIRTVKAPDQMLKRARTVFRMLFRTLGRARFFFLIRSLNRLSHIEQHYDTFDFDHAAIAAPTDQVDYRR